MIARRVSYNDLMNALKEVNKKYDNNIIWNREPEQINNNAFRFTLKVKDSKKPGHRLGFTGRRLINACWHVHGDFFDALLKINQDANITAGTLHINKDGGNWQDRNIGSQMQPLYYSEACECN